MKSMLNQANIRGPQFDGAAAQRWFLANRDLLGAVQQDAFADFIDLKSPYMAGHSRRCA